MTGCTVVRGGQMALRLASADDVVMARNAFAIHLAVIHRIDGDPHRYGMTGTAQVRCIDVCDWFSGSIAAVMAVKTGLTGYCRMIKASYRPGICVMTDITFQLRGEMTGAHANSSNVIMTGRTDQRTNRCMIHPCHCRLLKAYGGMTGVAVFCGRNMVRGLSYGKCTIMTMGANCWQFFEHAASVAGFAIDNTVLTFEGISRYQVIELTYIQFFFIGW